MNQTPKPTLATLPTLKCVKINTVDINITCELAVYYHHYY